jgi:hypothetical protein
MQLQNWNPAAGKNEVKEQYIEWSNETKCSSKKKVEKEFKE